MQTVEDRVLDIRKFRPSERDFRVFSAFEALKPHCSFTVITDAEPIALHREFEAELKGRFFWLPIENGPRQWKFVITKASQN